MPRARIGIDSWCYHKSLFTPLKNMDIKWTMTLDDFLVRAKQLGVDGVQLSSRMHLLSKESGYLNSLKKRLKELNLFVSLGADESIAVDDRDRIRVVNSVNESILATKTVGGEVCRMIAGFHRSDPGINIEEKMDNTVMTLRSILKTAEQNRIKLAVENHLDFTSRELVHIVKELDSEFVGVNLDTGNSIAAWEDPVEAAERLAPYTFTTHIKDVKVIPILEDNGQIDCGYKVIGTVLGTGVIDLPKIIRIILNTNKDIPLCVECYGTIDEDKSTEYCVRFLKNLLGSL